MTAAKIMDIISRLPGCAGQAADAVSAYTQVKKEDTPKVLKIPTIEISRHLDSSTTTQMAEIMVQHGRPSRSSRAKSVRSSLWQDCYVQGNLRKSYWSTVGMRFLTGNAHSYTVKKGYSYLCMWMTSNRLEKNKTLIRCGKYSIKKMIWENQHLSLIMCTWGALKDNEK